VTVVALGGLGAASLVLSGVFYAGAKSAETDASALSPRSGVAFDDAGARYDSKRTLSTVFFYGGAVLAGAALVTAIVWKPRSSTETSVRITPVGIAGAF
jgi:hypothetical protein